VVWVREIGTTPAKEEAIDWMLLTNQSAHTLERALDVIRAYAMRWRIEDFHRTWKSGHCDVEAMQLRSAAAAMKWATVLAWISTDADSPNALSAESAERRQGEHARVM
jgi:hypothetical protein